MLFFNLFELKFLVFGTFEGSINFSILSFEEVNLSMKQIVLSGICIIQWEYLSNIIGLPLFELFSQNSKLVFPFLRFVVKLGAVLNCFLVHILNVVELVLVLGQLLIKTSKIIL